MGEAEWKGKKVPGLKIPLKLRKVMYITYVCVYIYI